MSTAIRICRRPTNKETSMNDKELTDQQKMVKANLENGSIAAFARGEEIVHAGTEHVHHHPAFGGYLYVPKPKPAERAVREEQE